MNADGSHQRRLTDLQKWADAPAWSSDGKHIACRAAASYVEPFLTVIDVDEPQAHEVTALAMDALFAWSPDGKQLAFTGHPPDGSFQYGLGVVGASGANLRYLVTNIHGNDPGELLPDTPVWSSDGTHIAYTSYLEGGENLYRIGVDGTNLRRLTNSHEDEFIDVFDWQPETPAEMRTGV
jgi:Tol biopolymer transport system component